MLMVVVVIGVGKLNGLRVLMVMTTIPTILNITIFMMVTLKVLASLGGHDHGQLGSAVCGWMGCALVIIIMRDSKAELLLKVHIVIKVCIIC